MERTDKLYRHLVSQMLPVLAAQAGLQNLEKIERVVLETFSDVGKNSGMETNDLKNSLWEVLGAKSGLQFNAPDEDQIKKDQLKLLIACCDKNLSPKSQLTLILRFICGFNADETKDALLIPGEIISEKFERARSILEKGTLPRSLAGVGAEKLRLLHSAIYVLYMEGYSALEGKQIIRRELCLEAMRFLKTVLEIQELRNHDTYALMALTCFYSSKFQARVFAEGELLELEMQDRSLWDKELIKLGVQYLQYAHESNVASTFIYEAAIASVHAVAERYEETNWPVIAGLYDRLSDTQSGPRFDVRKATAIFYAHGAADALQMLDRSVHQIWLLSYAPYFVLLGKIYVTLGDGIEAIRNYEKALSLCKPGPDFEFVKSKINSLKVSMN